MSSNSYVQQHAEAMQKILAVLPASSPADFADFVAQFYAKLPISELVQYSPQEALELARRSFEFIGNRLAGVPKIRVSSEGRRSVVEIVNDDMPFLVDSITTELSRRGFVIYDTIHPILQLERAENGDLARIGGGCAQAESFIRVETSPLPDGEDKERFVADLHFILNNIRASVEDWHKIEKKAKDAAIGFQVGDEERKEAHDFLLWLANKNFVFLGYAEYEFFDDNGHENLSVINESRLGILRIDEEGTPRGLEALPPEVRHFLLVPQLIEITKSNRRSLVHRGVPMDYVGVKRFNSSGKVIGEARFLGLFTSNVYYQSTEAIPLVRGKVARVLVRSEFAPESHDGKALKAILEFLPRDEIFQMSEDELFEASMGILELEARPRVKMFVRKDAFERFISAMIFVPREQFSTDLRRQIQGIIEGAYNGVTSAFSTQITEAPLARLHLIVGTKAGGVPDVETKEIEQEIAKCAYQWADLLQEALLKKYDEATADRLLRVYANAFPQGYINSYSSAAAVYDIEKIELALAKGSLVLDLFKRPEEGDAFYHLKIYNPSGEIALSDILPMLECAGFRVIDEHPFLISPKSQGEVRVRDFRLHNAGNIAIAFDRLKPLLEEALLQTWYGKTERDFFDSLTLKAGLDYKQITVLRAYAKYLKQVNFPHGQAIIEQAFAAHPDIAEKITTFFEERFDPERKDSSASVLEDSLEQQLAAVSSAVYDLIFRRYIGLIKATLRTNYYQNKAVVSFKFSSELVPELPKPVPFAEIFVYSPRVEGIHLRGGKVARGGLRWSDRADDFRTEILGLMKAQMVKNTVIVPVGSKGGFYVKNPPSVRDAQLEEGIACYKLYLSGLLDVTDNIIDGKVVVPENVVRYDGDDPYLVVAADKGTATFSDIANSVSAAYNFWLGDAFASGGSAGYDHKKMAITARGAFVSVRRHFAEMGVNIDTTPFTVVGIGDMAGDVFGNGMLLSENIRLVAAFNHQHIFIDPTPDEKASFAERKRMFELPRSSWLDYNRALISNGGGIFERSAKQITISKEAAAAIGADKTVFTPDALIRTILLAPVDLLWNGGIGTYVKSEEETNEQVGDRANNSLRVNGRELRCKVIGEGGNLGFTQRGRIEYAIMGAGGTGGRINTDAIDNSAGVDCSDHEVNIKIAFSGEVASGRLELARRDAILADMTDEVAHLVLQDNLLQTQAISIAQAQGDAALASQIRLMHLLEEKSLLNREIEFLPSDSQLAILQEKKQGLTRPEIAVLLSYSKMELYRELLHSYLPDLPYFANELMRYFPLPMRNEFATAIEKHPLRQEIIATSITNSLVNLAGISFSFDLAKQAGVAICDVAAAYVVVRDVANLAERFEKAKDISELLGIQQRLEGAVLWLLGNTDVPVDIDASVARLSGHVLQMIDG